MESHGGIGIQWVGHATAVIRMGDSVIVTDPALTRRVAHLVRRHDRLPIGDVDLILISHLHADHLHRRSLGTLNPAEGYVVPRGAEKYLPRTAATVRSVTAGDRIDVPGTDVTVDVVHAEHDTHRGPHTRRTATPVGYVLRDPHMSVYFAGDTDLFPEMASIGPVDAALLPIGGWGPTTPPGHLNPESAAEAARLIDARVVIPIHWGTYAPAWSSSRAHWFRAPLPAFTAAMKEIGMDDRVRALTVGETLWLSHGPSADETP